MECKPIFDFLKEVRMPSIKTPCSVEDMRQYEREVLLCLLYDMKACLTECLMKTPSFDIDFIKDDLRRSRVLWEEEGRIIDEINPKVLQQWEERPEKRIPDLMLLYINEAERFVNKDYLPPVSDTAVEKPADKVSRKKCVEEKSVLTTKEVAERFGLPLNNVKDKQWRDRNGFPYRQFSRGGKVVFYTDEIEEWLECRKAS